MADDLYSVLGVSAKATKKEIRAAYRKLARKYHPDVNPGNQDAEDKFKKVTAANEILSDSKKRKAYDEFGDEALRGGFDPEKARAYKTWRDSRRQTGHPFESEVVDFNLGDLFGGAGGFGRPRARQGPRRGADLRAQLELNFEQAVRGVEVTLNVPSSAPCTACSGSGTKAGTSPRTCSECRGSGQRRVVQGPMHITATCTACHGSGSNRDPCPTCQGVGTRSETKPLTVRVPPGAETGSTIRLGGKGEPGTQGGPAGDLEIQTRVKPHPRVRRQGLDLYLKLPVTVAEAYRGATIEVPTFAGPVQMKVPPRSQTGTKLRLKSKGIDTSKKQGDFYIELEVRLPDQEDVELEQAFERAETRYACPVREGLVL